ncbi:MAG: PfaD family polyunsaturated fatty acid/polyketide biosynthesis protein [Gammaproteobacteria bacterium]
MEALVQSRETGNAPAMAPSVAQSVPSLAEHDVAARLGSLQFKREYGLRYAYVSGAMYRGIASKELVVAMGRAGLLGFLGTGGMPLEQIRADVGFIQQQLAAGQPYGVNLIASVANDAIERATVELLLELGVHAIEASAFMQVTPALVHYRLAGLVRGADGSIVCRNRVMAKLSRPEVARAFMSPAPQRIVERLLAEGKISALQAQLGATVPMANDICVEADSGGHTDQGVALVMLSAMQRLRAEMGLEPHALRIGLAGGIGTPEAVAAAFVMGADFVLTGSINQCTVEAGTNDAVKDLLQTIDIQDTDYAPAGDMFEMGAKVQVMKKGLFFPARANRLYMLYNQYDSLDQLPAAVREQLEEKYFKKTLAEVWNETAVFLAGRGRQDELDKAAANPKHKMALVFRWYFGHSMRAAIGGDTRHRVDYQIHTGPALGAFNRYVKGTALENWRARHVDQIGCQLMADAGALMLRRLKALEAPHS